MCSKCRKSLFLRRFPPLSAGKMAKMKNQLDSLEGKSRMEGVNFLHTTLLMAAACLMSPGMAQAQAPQAAQAAGAVASGLTKVAFQNAQPKLGAQYYIVLVSAPWCGPCHRTMPSVVKAYEEMKKDGRVELICVCDATPEKAMEYIRQYGGSFPLTTTKDPGIWKVAGVEKPQYVPHCTILTPEGKPLFRGNGAKVAEWRSLTIESGATPQKAQ